eukprot:5445761-Amphidinium_carterae.1
MWTEIAAAKIHAKGNMVMHSDSARAYRKVLDHIQGRTMVRHQLKKIDGKWHVPAFAKRTVLKLKNRKKYVTKSGTQYIDGFWSRLRDGVKSRVEHDIGFENLLRFTQWKYWMGGKEALTDHATAFGLDCGWSCGRLVRHVGVSERELHCSFACRGPVELVVPGQPQQDSGTFGLNGCPLKVALDKCLKLESTQQQFKGHPLSPNTLEDDFRQH